MPSVGASYQIGRSALAAYQAAISVVGQNIANVGNPDYARQSVALSSIDNGNGVLGASPGNGVQLSALQRHMDEALESRLRMSLSSKSAAEFKYRYLSQIEALYNELTDGDLSSQLNELFGAFGDLQTSPEDSGVRTMVIASADAVIDTIQRQYSGILQQVEEMNDAAAMAVEEANRLASEVAALNTDIVVQESDGQSVASALRDRRDSLLRDLSEMMDITVREQKNGTINVYVGSEPLVEFDRSRGLTVEQTYQNGIGTFEVRFADNNGNVLLGDGKLAGIVNTRDEEHLTQLNLLDQLARGLVYEVNRVHAAGAGLHGLTSVVGAFAADDADAALNSTTANLTYPVENGSFIVNLRDQATGEIVTRMIEVDLDGLNGDDTTLNSLAADMNAIDGLNVSVTADNRLSVSAEANTEFWFSEDSSGAAGALGLNAFFTGEDAGDIDIAAALRNDPTLIVASATGATGDGDQAGRLSALAESGSALLGNRSVGDFHLSLVNELAVSAHSAKTAAEAADTVHASLTAQRESISGVSLDEEALNLSMYEQSFQGAARFLSVMESLTGEIMRLVR